MGGLEVSKRIASSTSRDWAGASGTSDILWVSRLINYFRVKTLSFEGKSDFLEKN
jgi:hypothetical protein